MEAAAEVEEAVAAVADWSRSRGSTSARSLWAEIESEICGLDSEIWTVVWTGPIYAVNIVAQEEEKARKRGVAAPAPWRLNSINQKEEGRRSVEAQTKSV